MVGDRDARDLAQLLAHRGGVERCGDPLAPRRRAKPRQIHHVSALGDLVCTIDRNRVIGLVDRVEQHRLSEAKQWCKRLWVAVW